MKKVISRTKEQTLIYKYCIGPHKKIKVCDAEVRVGKDGKVDHVSLCLLNEKEIDWAIELLKRIKKDFRGKWAEDFTEFIEKVKKIAGMTHEEIEEMEREVLEHRLKKHRAKVQDSEEEE